MRRLIIVIGLWSLAIGAWVLVLAPSEVAEETTTRVIKIAEPNPNPYYKLYDELLRPSVKITAGISTGSGVVIATTDYTDEHSPRTRIGAGQGLTQVYILTAAHVVDNESSVSITFYGESTATITATVVITDTNKDLALLRIETTDEHSPRTRIGAGQGLTQIYSAKLAPRNYQPYLFTEVWTVGCSLGLPPRPSSGHICAICGSYWEMSAPIVPGNSGGGVFLKDTHELIGIAVWVRTYRGQLITTMAGIVPIQSIYEFLDSYEGQIVVR